MLRAMLTDAALVAFVATADLKRSHAFYGGVLGLHLVETTAFANVYDAYASCHARGSAGASALHGSQLESLGHQGLYEGSDRPRNRF